MPGPRPLEVKHGVAVVGGVYRERCRLPSNSDETWGSGGRAAAVIAGLGVMIFYLSLPVGLYGTVWILVLALSFRFATTTRLARAGFMQIHQELEEASATSGARWLATQRNLATPERSRLATERDSCRAPRRTLHTASTDADLA